MDPATFGQLVEREREARRLTQFDLGISVGCSRAYIAHLEADTRVPTPCVLVGLSDALGVDLGLMTRLAARLQARLAAAAPRAAS